MFSTQHSGLRCGKEFNPIELFVATKSLNYDKQLNCGWALNAIAVACSNLLQAGVDPSKVSKFSNNIQCPMYSVYGTDTCPEHMQGNIQELIKLKAEGASDGGLQKDGATNQEPTGKH